MSTKTFPPEAQGLNWGAFLMSWIWGAFNGVGCGPLALMFFLPGIGSIIGLIKGNEWAWLGKDWQSVEQFKAAQRKWVIAGAILLVVCIVLACLTSVVPLLLGGGMR